MGSGFVARDDKARIEVDDGVHHRAEHAHAQIYYVEFVSVFDMAG
jgi:hypothetical protein